MKQLLAIIAVLLLAGCSTVEKQSVCDSAQAAYSAYVLVINSGVQPTEDQIIAAKYAAATLTALCGWTSPQKGLMYGDRNGVQVIIPPK